MFETHVTCLLYATPLNLCVNITPRLRYTLILLNVFMKLRLIMEYYISINVYIFILNLFIRKFNRLYSIPTDSET